MTLGWRTRWTVAGLICCSFAAAPHGAIAQRFDAPREQGGEQPRDRLREPLYRVAENTAQPRNAATPATPAADTRPQTDAQAAANEHPLTPVLKMAYDGLDKMDKNVQDYACTMVKRERIDGKLGEHQFIAMKVRHKPFSVYMYFLGPDSVKGREAIYVEGKNDGKLMGHEGGFGGRLLKRISLDPDSALAMRGQRYPITKVGIRNLTQELVTVGEHDKKFGECEVKFFQKAKVQDRVCTCIQVVHPTPRKNFRFHLARVYIDDELQIPIRYESYDWPQKEGATPVLLEEYTYMKLKLNVGLKDADFDPDNPNYNFQ